MHEKEEYYSFTQLVSFFHFLREEGGRMEKEDVRLLLAGFELLLARSLPTLSLRDVEFIIHELIILEGEFKIPREKEIPESEPLSAFELLEIPSKIREDMKKGELTAETLKSLLAKFERELEKSSSKITLAQSYQLHQEKDNLKKEFEKRE
jgi:hypothetical protein